MEVIIITSAVWKLLSCLPKSGPKWGKTVIYGLSRFKDSLTYDFFFVLVEFDALTSMPPPPPLAPARSNEDPPSSIFSSNFRNAKRFDNRMEL